MNAAGARRGHYSDAVRRRFASPRHAGRLAEGQGRRISAAVEEGGAGARILLEGIADGDRWTRLGYCIFGCPHLLAAAEAACERFEGGPVGSVCEFPLDEIMATLEIPFEKTGRVLLLEDAFRQLHAGWAECA